MAVLKIGNNIVIPAIQVGSSDEPVITAREMPDDWKYFTSLKESDKDQAYLYFSGASDTFFLNDLLYFPNVAYVTLYGGSNGTTPLYRCFWSDDSSSRYWAHYENGAWVRNTNQISSLDFYEVRLEDADLDNYPKPYTLRFSDLTGKQVTNDPHIGTTQLFTVIVHTSNSDYAQTRIAANKEYGGTTTSAPISNPLIAYSGGSNCLKSSSNTRLDDLEFVEILGGTETHINFASDTYWLGRVALPDTVTTMDNASFIKSYGLQLAEFSSGITTIPENTCQNCYNLKKVILKEGVTSIGDTAFQNCYNLEVINFPSTLTTIGYASFQYAGLKDITLSSGVTTIGESAFQYSTAESISLPNTVTSIGGSAFSDNNRLKTVTMSTGMDYDSTALFMNCRALEEVTIGAGATILPQDTFNGCDSLKHITMPNTIEGFGGSCFAWCASLVEIVIPNGCSLDTYCFNYCDNLERVTLPNDLEEIPSSCFANCKSLQDLTLPSTLTTIASSAFTHANNIKKMVIPANVTSIAGSAFSNMGGCRYFKMLGSPPTLSNASAFSGGNTYVKILVPYDYINNYWTATNWSSATNNIKRKLKGYKTFQQGDTLPTNDSTGNRTLKWYELDDILVTTATGSPTGTQLTTAPYDGEFYCTIT